MKFAAAVVKMMDAGDNPTAVQGRKAANNALGATARSLLGNAGETARAFPLLPTAQLLSVYAVCVCRLFVAQLVEQCTNMSYCKSQANNFQIAPIRA